MDQAAPCSQAEIHSHQIAHYGLFEEWISFQFTGALCPDSCRSVDAANICCNGRNLGEEMLENEK